MSLHHTVPGYASSGFCSTSPTPVPPTPLPPLLAAGAPTAGRLPGGGGGAVGTGKMSQVEKTPTSSGTLRPMRAAPLRHSCPQPRPARSFQCSFSCPTGPSTEANVHSPISASPPLWTWGRRKDLREGREGPGTEPSPWSEDNCSLQGTRGSSPCVASRLGGLPATGGGRMGAKREEGGTRAVLASMLADFKIQMLAIPGQQESHTQLYVLNKLNGLSGDEYSSTGGMTPMCHAEGYLVSLGRCGTARPARNAPSGTREGQGESGPRQVEGEGHG